MTLANSFVIGAKTLLVQLPVQSRSSMLHVWGAVIMRCFDVTSSVNDEAGTMLWQAWVRMQKLSHSCQMRCCLFANIRNTALQAFVGYWRVATWYLPVATQTFAAAAAGCRCGSLDHNVASTSKPQKCELNMMSNQQSRREQVQYHSSGQQRLCMYCTIIYTVVLNRACIVAHLARVQSRLKQVSSVLQAVVPSMLQSAAPGVRGCPTQRLRQSAPVSATILHSRVCALLTCHRNRTPRRVWVAAEVDDKEGVHITQQVLNRSTTPLWLAHMHAH